MQKYSSLTLEDKWDNKTHIKTSFNNQTKTLFNEIKVVYSLNKKKVFHCYWSFLAQILICEEGKLSMVGEGGKVSCKI